MVSGEFTTETGCRVIVHQADPNWHPPGAWMLTLKMNKDTEIAPGVDVRMVSVLLTPDELALLVEITEAALGEAAP